jgi:hypothetical protein
MKDLEVTDQEFSGVDFDRLAEYLGGALDGTPAAAEIEHLVTHDARWREAYAALGAALDRVRNDLGRLGATREPMPADVVGRLEEALRAGPQAVGASASPGSTDDARPAARQPVRRSATAGRAIGAPPASRPARDGVGPPTRRHRSRGRWTRWAGLTAAAAAVVALGALGANVLGGRLPSNGDNATSANGGYEGSGRDDQAPAAPSVTAGGVALTVQASGSDYRPDTIATLGRRLAAPARASQSAAEGTADKGVAPRPAADLDAVPGELRRLTDPAELSACLTALITGYRAPASVQAVDYARFEGRPAVVVIFADGDGGRWAAAVGPHCGLPWAGANERFATRVP